MYRLTVHCSSTHLQGRVSMRADDRKTSFERTFRRCVQQVIDDHEPLRVIETMGLRGDRGEDWQRDQETLYVLQNQSLMEQIARSLQTTRRSTGRVLTLEEQDALDSRLRAIPGRGARTCGSGTSPAQSPLPRAQRDAARSSGDRHGETRSFKARPLRSLVAPPLPQGSAQLQV